MFDLGKVKLLAGSPLEDVENVLAGRLKVRGCVVRLGNEELASDAVVEGRVDV